MRACVRAWVRLIKRLVYFIVARTEHESTLSESSLDNELADAGLVGSVTSVSKEDRQYGTF